MDGEAGRESSGWRVRHVEVRRHTAAQAGLAMLTAVLAEWPDQPGRFLEFQIARHRRERADGYCLVDAPVDSLVDHRTVFGGLTACRLRGSERHLAINDEAQAMFG